MLLNLFMECVLINLGFGCWELKKLFRILLRKSKQGNLRYKVTISYLRKKVSGIMIENSSGTVEMGAYAYV